MKPIVLKVLDWRISLGVSFASFAFNLAYFWLIQHDLLQSIKYSVSSVVTVAALHGAHAVVVAKQGRQST